MSDIAYEDRLLVTVAQAAQMLGLSTKAIYELASAGEFTKRYVGKGRFSYRLEVAELREYVRQLPTEPRR